MPFSTTYTRTKTFVPAGSFTTADMNSIQDDLGNQLALANVQAGINEGSNVRRGKFIQPAAGTRTNVAYGALSNGPDQVANLVLPTDSLLVIGYQATMQESVSSSSSAALFIGSNQLKALFTGSPGPVVQSAMNVLTPINTDYVVTSSPHGLITMSANVVAYTGDVTTGQALGIYENTVGGIGIGSSVGTAQSLNVASTMWGGLCTVFVAAGTYNISVQFKSTSGSVSVKNRKLWVRTESYG